MSETRAKHVPERTCAACRQKRPQAECLRFTRTGEGWVIQTGKKRTGRGVYLCNTPECWQEKKLRRTFRQDAPQVAALLHTRHSLQPSTDQLMQT